MEEVALFVDRRGREWSLSLDVGLCRKVLREHQVDLANWHDGKAAHVLALDDAKLVDVLWSLVAEQAKERGLDEEAFAGSLNGDVLAAALDAIRAAVVGFTRPDRRELVRQINAKADQITQRAVAKTLEQLTSQETDQAIERALERHVDKARKELSTIGK